MKQELRCHAVLCPSENKAKAMAQRLQDRLHQALVDFKREKISRQNARLSLANSVYDNPSMPYRKILLHTGSSNYRPPHERGKSAPKLKAIEEEDTLVEEEEEDEEEELPMSAPPFATASPNPLRRSASEPLTEVTSLASSADFTPDVAVIVDLDDAPDGNQTPSFVPMDGRERAEARRGLSEEASRRLMASFDDEDDDEEEDEVIDYIPAEVAAAAAADVSNSDSYVTIAAVTVHDSSTDPDDVIVAFKSEEEEVDSAAPVSPDSNRFSTRSSSIRSSSQATTAPTISSDAPSTSSARQKLDSAQDADSIGEDEEEDAHRPSAAASATRRPSEHEDAISDESGYSEESNPSSRKVAARREDSHSGNTTVVTLNASSLPRPSKLKEDRDTTGSSHCDTSGSSDGDTTLTGRESPIQCDLTVHSAALVADYKESTVTANGGGGVDFLQNRITEFCINI